MMPYLSSIYTVFMKEFDVGDGSWWNISQNLEGGLLGNVPQNKKKNTS